MSLQISHLRQQQQQQQQDTHTQILWVLKATGHCFVQFALILDIMKYNASINLLFF